MRKRIFDLVGESKRNDDGSYRQLELLRLDPGTKVGLLREPDNPHDRNAIKVFSVNQVCIGYISAADAVQLAPQIDAGEIMAARIHEMRGGVGQAEFIGCRIAIRKNGEEFRPYKFLDHQQMDWRESKSKRLEMTNTSSSRGCLGVMLLIAIGISAASYWVSS